MEVKASWRFVARPAKAAAPALAAFLVTSAGVAAIAQPIEPRPEPAPSLFPRVAPPILAPAPASVQAATVRIVLPSPIPLTGSARGKSDEAPGFTASRLDAIASEPGTMTPALTQSLAQSVPKPASAPLRMAPDPTDAPQPMSAPPTASAPRPKAPTAGLVAARGISDADYSAAIRTISARPESKAIPMVDPESRAALARMNGDDEAAPSSGTERPDALQPARTASSPHAMAPARSLVEADPRESRPVGMSSIRMQDDDGVSRYRRTAQGLAFDVATTVNGASVGKVSLLIRDGENISIRLADLLAAVQPAIDPALYQKLSASQAAQSYMTFNELREAGIAVRFNDNDRLILGIK